MIKSKKTGREKLRGKTSRKGMNYEGWKMKEHKNKIGRTSIKEEEDERERWSGNNK